MGTDVMNAVIAVCEARGGMAHGAGTQRRARAHAWARRWLARAWRSLSARIPAISSREPDTWQVLYDLRTEEAAVGSRPSPVEVREMLLAYEQAAAKLVRLGEPDRAQDVLHVLMPAFRERSEVVAVMHAQHHGEHAHLAVATVVGTTQQQDAQSGPPQPSFPPPPAHAPLASRVRVVVALPRGGAAGAARVSLLGVA